MATNNYTSYTILFRESSTKEGVKYGLSFSLRKLFAVVPAAIGHLLDTLFGTENFFVKEGNAHLFGLFGRIFSIVPFFVGALVGLLLQLALNSTMYIGYYLIDTPLTWLIKHLSKSPYSFTQGMLGQLGRPGIPLQFIYGFYTTLTQTPRHEMHGLFGFLLGFIPQTVAYIIDRFACTMTSVIEFSVDKICDPFKRSKKTAATSDTATQQSQPEATAVPGVRIKQPEMTNIQELNDIIDQKVDLFAALDMTSEEYKREGVAAVKKKHRAIVLACHPDKDPTGLKRNEFEKATKAKDILEDAEKGRTYLQAYSMFHRPTRPAPAPTHSTFGKENVAANGPRIYSKQQ